MDIAKLGFKVIFWSINVKFIKPYEFYHISLIIVFIELCYNYFYYFSRFVYVASSHTKYVFFDVIVDCILEWNIDRKLSTITVDNCSTNDVMIRLLLNMLDTSQCSTGAFRDSGAGAGAGAGLCNF